MTKYEPSQISLALLDVYCEANSKEEALAMAKQVGDHSREMINTTLAKFEKAPLYALQCVGELMIATAQSTLEKMAAQENRRAE